MSNRWILVATLTVAVVAASPASAGPEDGWPSYNRTLTSQRFVPHLKIVCTYDTDLRAL